MKYPGQIIMRGLLILIMIKAYSGVEWFYKKSAVVLCLWTANTQITLRTCSGWSQFLQSLLSAQAQKVSLHLTWPVQSNFSRSNIFVLGIGSSSHWGLIIASVQMAKGDNLEVPFRSTIKYCYVELNSLESPHRGDSNEYTQHTFS